MMPRDTKVHLTGSQVAALEGLGALFRTGFIDRLDFSDMISAALETSSEEGCVFRDIIFCYPGGSVVKIQVYLDTIGQRPSRPHSAWPAIRNQRTYYQNWAPHNPGVSRISGHWA